MEKSSSKNIVTDKRAQSVMEEINEGPAKTYPQNLTGHSLDDKFNLVIVGGGVGGLVAASGAGQLGAKVALIEKETLGGDCLHYGCVPTKTLIHSAKIASLMRRSEEFSLEKKSMKVNFSKSDGTDAKRSGRDRQKRRSGTLPKNGYQCDIWRRTVS